MTTRIWINGVPCTSGAARIDPTAPLGAWGEGFFETARIRAGEILALPQHKMRMQRSLKAHYAACFDEPEFEYVWTTARQSAEGIEHAKIRIVATPTSPSACELRYITTLSDWSPPNNDVYRLGVAIDFTALPHPQLGSLGKSTSYHWARLATYDARRRGLDDVVFARADTVIETTTASLLCLDGSSWVTPDRSSGCLDSTTLRAFESAGLTVRRTEISVSELRSFETIALINATRLAIGVRKLGDQTFDDPDRHTRSLRALLLPSTETYP